VKQVFNSKLAMLSISSVAFGIILFCWLQLFWIKRYSADLDDNIAVRLKHQDLMVFFLDPNTTKTLTLSNKESGAEVTYEYWSEDWNTYFFVLDFDGKKTIVVKDAFRGANELDYNTLRPRRERGNRFDDMYSEFRQASDSIELGKPALAFIDGKFVR
jgi:hypothetical protein